MTDTLPAVIAPPSPAEWRAMSDQAAVIAASGLAPSSVRTKEQVLVIAMKGRELQVPPMQALSHIHVVEGKPTLSAEMMVALVQRAGHRVRVTHTDAAKATVQGIRADDPEFTAEVTYTIEEAGQAGVAGKQNWKRHPAAMLRARAISALCRMHFADVLMGASYTAEELGADVDVAEDGSVVTVTAVEPAQKDEDEEHQRLLAELDGLLQQLPEDKRKASWEFAEKGVEWARKAIDHVTGFLADAEERFPFDPVTDETLRDLEYELGQLKEGDRKKEIARMLGDDQVSDVGELSDRTAAEAQRRLTQRRAEREADEAAKEARESKS